MIKTITLFCLFLSFTVFFQNYKTKNTPQGTFKYEIYFAEFGGRMNNATCDLEIKGNKIKVLQDGTRKLTGGKVLFDGIIIKHKSGVWILADDESDKDAEEVGGCSEFPIIYFDCKLIEWC